MFKQLIPSFQERSKQFIISSVSEEGKKGKNNTKKSLNFFELWYLVQVDEKC
jgi:hypothetical protein